MKYLVILFFVTCTQVQPEQPELSGTYQNIDVILTFDNGKLTGHTQCNDLIGNYILMDDNISISIGGTKVFCEGEFDIQRLRDVEKYEILGSKLKLYSSSEIITLIKK